MAEHGKQQHESQTLRRLGTALRENLKRRKAQAKGRAAAEAGAERAAKPHDSAGIVDDKRSG